DQRRRPDAAIHHRAVPLKELMMTIRTAATIRALLSPLLRFREGGTAHAGACGLPPSLTLPQRKSGLPDLRKIKYNPGKPGLLGEGSGNSLPRSLLLATALLAAGTATARAQVRDDVIAAPVLRANVSVAGELVRIGDVIDNAGSF